MSQIIASTYEIIEKLGAGGGGNVYLANHLRLGKKVVLKADKRKITTKQEWLRREVDVLKELNHPNIPKVYDYFAEGETTYTVIDYIEGESLDKPLKRGERFSQAQVIFWALQLLDALDYLHKPVHGKPPRGFVHSDIKPANLMRTLQGDICLIDFNIALALGEECVIGRSPGYSSPEHYGLDFSTDDEKESLSEEDAETVTIQKAGVSEGELPTITLDRKKPGSYKERSILPDVRSDIYSVGATLYHLLSGKRPDKYAKNVEQLSGKEFSPLVVAIIAKAMDPNPERRYQTAGEMRWDFLNLRKNDPRAKRWRRKKKIFYTLFPVCFAVGLFMSFLGLKRMQKTEESLKLAEYSENALENGDAKKAVSYALQALPEPDDIFTPSYQTKAQRALAKAAGIYDLSDGYKIHETVRMPTEVLYTAISPQGKTACVLYKDHIAVINMENADIDVTLPADASALSEMEYLNEHTIVYAGSEGIAAYDLVDERELWSGKPATAIAVSGDGSTAAAVYKDETYAVIYDTATGEIKMEIDFEGKSQSVTVNDIFANPRDNLLELNEDGSMLGVSFNDGSLKIYNLGDLSDKLILLEEESGYTHFEGGFHKQYFAFSASNDRESAFAIVDTASGSQTGGFFGETAFGVQTDEKGIYVQSDNILVEMDPISGEQTPLVTMTDNIRRFAVGTTHTLVTTENEVLFFDKNASLTARYKKDGNSDLVNIAGRNALLGDMDSPVLRIMKYENHPEANILSYDAKYEHDEARISADQKTIMLFSYTGFCIYGTDGTLLCEKEIPEPKQVYDQQYVREETKSYLQVIYNDGRINTYDAGDGKLLSEKTGEKPDKEMYEEFYTQEYRIESPLHGTPVVYDAETDQKITELEQEAYLTYVTEGDEYIIAQYVTAEGICFGQLLDKKCEVLAELPNLCDVTEDFLLFDYPTGDIRKSKIYQIDEIIQTARNSKEEK